MAHSTRAFSLALRLHGLHQYARRFEQADLPAVMLHSLTNVELREDFGIQSLSHRRKILRLLTHAQRHHMLPMFGEILVHLSNVRTFHSWMRSAFQLVTFSFAIAPLGALRATKLADALALALTTLGALLGAYGGYSYLKTAHQTSTKAAYHADVAGASLAALLSLIACALTLHVILVRELTVSAAG